MTILVTGSSGFIGTNLVNYLRDKKIKFVAIDKRKNRYLKFKNFYKIDLNNLKKTKEIIYKNKIRQIIHLAAIPGFVNCHLNPESAFNDNIKSTFNLLLATKNTEVKKILLASSMGVDNFNKSPSFYGFTKLVCENLCKTFNTNYKTDITICKISNVFGPYSLHKSSSVHAFIKNILRNKKVRIHKNGKQKRDFIFVQKVCEKLTNSVLSKSKKKYILINTNKFFKIIDIAKTLVRISKKKISYDFVETPKGYDDKVYRKPIKKIKIGLIKNLETTYDWYKRNLKKI